MQTECFYCKAKIPHGETVCPKCGKEYSGFPKCPTCVKCSRVCYECPDFFKWFGEEWMDIRIKAYLLSIGKDNAGAQYMIDSCPDCENCPNKKGCSNYRDCTYFTRWFTEVSREKKKS